MAVNLLPRTGSDQPIGAPDEIFHPKEPRYCRIPECREYTRGYGSKSHKASRDLCYTHFSQAQKRDKVDVEPPKPPRIDPAETLRADLAQKRADREAGVMMRWKSGRSYP